MKELLSKKQDEISAFLVWDVETKTFVKAFESCDSLSYEDLPDDLDDEDADTDILYGWIVEGFTFSNIGCEFDDDNVEIDKVESVFKTGLRSTPMLQAFKEIASMALDEDEVLTLTKEEVLKRFVLIEMV